MRRHFSQQQRVFGGVKVEVFRRLKRFYQPYLPYLGASLVMLVFATALGLVYPYLLSLIVDKVIEAHDIGLLPMLIAGILVASAAKGLCNFGQQYVGQLFGIRSVYKLRNTLYRKLSKLPFGYFDNVHTGDLMSRMTADLDAFRMFLAFGFNSIVSFVLLVVFGLALMVFMNWELTLAVLVLMPVLAWLAISFDGRLWPAYRRVRKNLGLLNTSVQENVMGVRTVKSFAREGFEQDKFGDRNGAYFDANIATAVLWKKYFPYMQLVGNIEVVVVLVFGGFLVIRGQLSLGDLVAFFSILWYIVDPMSQLGYLLNNWTQSKAAGERLLEILEAPITIDSPAAGRTDRVRGHVRFRSVSLVQGGQTVLEDIDFDAPAGSTIGILGMTGAGKSSLVNLIGRFYDVTDGAVEVDGTDVREWDLHALRRGVGIVFQETFLFSTTIFANIAYGRPEATEEEVERAARLADAAEFIEALPDGYRTLVGERGIGLSGGQKQRIALARAILADPAVLILDDATSAVDMETEYKIQQSLKSVMAGRTTFVIAHRISSLKAADLIVVLADGRIAEFGTHEQLLSLGGHYREIYDMQYRDHEALAEPRRVVGLEAAVGLQGG
jgi:ATP-binding cassette subfamily B multidrug efflux pump